MAAGIPLVALRAHWRLSLLLRKRKEAAAGSFDCRSVSRRWRSEGSAGASPVDSSPMMIAPENRSPYKACG